ncbi:hypothetical protein EP7_002103 [Isosphaeraceae bacterium EP7]
MTETPEPPVPSLYLSVASIFLFACFILEAIGLHLMLGWARERRQKNVMQAQVVAGEPDTAVEPVNEIIDEEALLDVVAESR